MMLRCKTQARNPKRSTRTIHFLDINCTAALMRRTNESTLRLIAAAVLHLASCWYQHLHVSSPVGLVLASWTSAQSFSTNKPAAQGHVQTSGASRQSTFLSAGHCVLGFLSCTVNLQSVSLKFFIFLRPLVVYTLMCLLFIRHNIEEPQYCSFFIFIMFFTAGKRQLHVGLFMYSCNVFYQM